MPRSTDRDRWSAAVAHLSHADPKLGAWIDQYGPCTLTPRPASQRFEALVHSIVSQMVSVAAARAIKQRLHHAVGTPLLPPSILRLGPERLRPCGLSSAKARSILGLASRVADGQLNLARIGRLSDEAIIARLTEVPGIGVWTAQMFLIFALGRPDILAPGDLGIRTGLKHHFELSELPGAHQCAELSEPWRPFRSIAMWYLWRLVEFRQSQRSASGRV